MKFIRDVVYSGLVGTPEENKAVDELLTFDKDHPSFLRKGILYTGLIDFVVEQLGSIYPIEIEDNFEWGPTPIKDIEIPSGYLANGDANYQDRPYQIIAAKKALHKGRGIIELPTGSGKTEVAAIVLKYLFDNGLAKKAFFIVGSRFLMAQAADRFEVRGFSDVGRFGGGHKFHASQIQCCVTNSLTSAFKYSRQEVLSEFAQCDVVIFDETHHLSAKSWVALGETCPAKYRYGLTATLWSDPFQYSHSDFYLIGLTGGIVAHVPSSYLRRKGYLAEPVVTMLNVSKPVVRGRDWHKYYEKGIVQHPVRNSIIVSLARSLYEGDYRTLVFTNRINHGMLLVKHLREFGCREVVFVKGGEVSIRWLPSGRWEYTNSSIGELAEYVDENKQVIVVASSVFDEGIDVPAFNALIMTTAMKKYRRTIQRAGRGMRPKVDDNRVFIFDFIDGMHDKLLEHSAYRMATYRHEEYQMLESLNDMCEAMGIPILLEGNIFKWDQFIKKKTHRRSYRG